MFHALAIAAALVSSSPAIHPALPTHPALCPPSSHELRVGWPSPLLEDQHPPVIYVSQPRDPNSHTVVQLTLFAFEYIDDYTEDTGFWQVTYRGCVNTAPAHR